MVGFQQESEKVALWWKIYVCAVGFCAVGVSVNVCWIKHFISTFAAAIAIKQPFLYKHKDKNHKTGSIFTFFNHSLIEKETCYVFFHFSACSYGLNHLFSLFRFFWLKTNIGYLFDQKAAEKYKINTLCWFFFLKTVRCYTETWKFVFHGFKPLKPLKPLKLWSGQIETFSLKYTMRLLWKRKQSIWNQSHFLNHLRY